MPLHFSAAHSSRITKRSSTSKAPSLRRSASSPFAQLRRQKSTLQRAQTKPETASESYHEEEEDTPHFPSRIALHSPHPHPPQAQVTDIPEAIQQIRNTQFEPVPDRGGGFSSTRRAEILIFRRRLPPLVTVAHLHAVIGNPTRVERELTALIKDGVVRKVVIPGRGAEGEGVVLMKDLELLVRESIMKGSNDAEEEEEEEANGSLAGRFLDLLKRSPNSLLEVPWTEFSANDISSLSRAGFLTSPSALHGPTAPLSGTGDAGTLTSIASIARSASGSLSAVGGMDALLSSGGSGAHAGLRRSTTSSSSFTPTGDPLPEPGSFTAPPPPPTTISLSLSLPSTGPYLKLLTSSLSHLLALIQKSTAAMQQSHTREIPLEILRERWEGGVADVAPLDGSATPSVKSQAQAAKRYRGEFVGVFPARTKKWKRFCGVRVL